MIKDIFKGLGALIALIIFIPCSFYLCKQWIKNAKELNEHGRQLPTSYWKVYVENMKELLWEDSMFD